ncbi:MAG: dihydropteroate synthase [Flammeovirgaceae bacterium]|nr:dihydropteroate synthase [Flammeovirgaceae bacterium]
MAQSKVFSSNKTLNIGGRIVDLSIPKIMGILNITPDSFYTGSRVQTEKEILTQAEKMLAEGADFLDIGGYSSRPGAEDISQQEELARVVPAIQFITKQFPESIISIDTFRSSVARAAVSEGAQMINDISGGTLDEKMFEVAGELKVPYILMHMRGTPQTMTGLSVYENIAKEISGFFHRQVYQLGLLGVYDIILDPGFGFAKTAEQNFQLLKNLDLFKIHPQPILVGLSRKSMIWKTLQTTPEQSLNGTSVVNTMALMKGANILRVHDAKEAKDAIALFTKANLNA